MAHEDNVDGYHQEYFRCFPNYLKTSDNGINSLSISYEFITSHISNKYPDVIDRVPYIIQIILYLPFS